MRLSKKAATMLPLWQDDPFTGGAQGTYEGMPTYSGQMLTLPKGND